MVEFVLEGESGSAVGEQTISRTGMDEYAFEVLYTSSYRRLVSQIYAMCGQLGRSAGLCAGGLCQRVAAPSDPRRGPLPGDLGAGDRLAVGHQSVASGLPSPPFSRSDLREGVALRAGGA